MGQDWILDVLTDLKTFARANGMPSLAAQLDDASFVAQTESSSGWSPLKVLRTFRT
mgnify:CR=1 FL=1